MPNDFADHPMVQALDDAIGALTYLREGGTKMVPVDAQVWRDFIAPPAQPAPPPTPAPQTLPTIPEPSRVQQGAKGDTPEQRSAAMGAFAQTITACSGCACANAEGRLLGRGVIYNPTLAVVNGAGLIGDQAMAQGSRLEGDAGVLLEKMIGAIGIQMKDVYVTHAMKCAVEKKPASEALQTCAKYLRSELQMVRPRAIVLLGPVAAKALFVKGMAAAGTVGQWNLFTMGGVHIPTITLHHPMRLLMLGDEHSVPLKKENWAALQALQAKLKA